MRRETRSLAFQQMLSRHPPSQKAHSTDHQTAADRPRMLRHAMPVRGPIRSGSNLRDPGSDHLPSPLRAKRERFLSLVHEELSREVPYPRDDNSAPPNRVTVRHTRAASSNWRVLSARVYQPRTSDRLTPLLARNFQAELPPRRLDRRSVGRSEMRRLTATAVGNGTHALPIVSASRTSPLKEISAAVHRASARPHPSEPGNCAAVTLPTPGHGCPEDTGVDQSLVIIKFR